MAELVQRVGLGMAARGSVRDVVRWAGKAERMGLDSVFVHDSYFERDAVSYASALASQVPRLKIGLGAVNPFTRHPVVLAMTVSALDEMAPGRVVCALGTGLPLRLGQMGIPYSSAEGVEGVARAIELLRAMWRGDRLAPGRPGLPPLQAMFPPVHHTPVYVAAYRPEMLRMAGQCADGFLARPVESIPGLTSSIGHMRDGARAAGREADLTVAGYLLSLTGPTRSEALNRAKREPFVIYMMSVLSDASLSSVGIPPELRDEIARAWHDEEYHRAAEIIPDELLDSFLLCGTVEDVATRTLDYHDAGMDLPLLQPVVQEEAQVDSLLDAAVLYGSGHVAAPLAADSRDDRAQAHPTAPGSERARARLASLLEIARPFSLTASVVPVATAVALAAEQMKVTSWPLAAGAIVAAVLLQVGTNVLNEVFDVRRGVDSITSPRASHAILKGLISERAAVQFACAALFAAVLVGAWMTYKRGWLVVVLGVVGLLGGVGYTAPPLELKYRALGIPLVFVLMGPLMVEGAYFVSTGDLSLSALAVSIPVGCLVAAILHGNEWRDISEDARAGIVTLSIRLGAGTAHLGYLALVVGAFMALALVVVVGAAPPSALAAMLSLPLLVRVVRASELGAAGERRRLAKIDLATAQLHAAFGALMVLGLAAAA